MKPLGVCVCVCGGFFGLIGRRSPRLWSVVGPKAWASRLALTVCVPSRCDPQRETEREREKALGRRNKDKIGLGAVFPCRGLNVLVQLFWDVRR